MKGAVTKAIVRAEDMDVVIAEIHVRQETRWANTEETTEFRKFIRDIMAQFGDPVKGNKHIKKVPVRIDSRSKHAKTWITLGWITTEEMALTILDPAFKAWEAKMKGVQYAKLDDIKEANTMTTSNFVTVDRTKLHRRLYKEPWTHCRQWSERMSNVKMTNETCFGGTWKCSQSQYTPQEVH